VDCDVVVHNLGFGNPFAEPLLSLSRWYFARERNILASEVASLVSTFVVDFMELLTSGSGCPRLGFAHCLFSKSFGHSISRLVDSVAELLVIQCAPIKPIWDLGQRADLSFGSELKSQSIPGVLDDLGGTLTAALNDLVSVETVAFSMNVRFDLDPATFSIAPAITFLGFFRAVANVNRTSPATFTSPLHSFPPSLSLSHLNSYARRSHRVASVLTQSTDFLTPDLCIRFLPVDSPSFSALFRQHLRQDLGLDPLSESFFCQLTTVCFDALGRSRETLGRLGSIIPFKIGSLPRATAFAIHDLSQVLSARSASEPAPHGFGLRSVSHWLSEIVPQSISVVLGDIGESLCSSRDAFLFDDVSSFDFDFDCALSQIPQPKLLLKSFSPIGRVCQEQEVNFRFPISA
jgi:hypothetical protein